MHTYVKPQPDPHNVPELDHFRFNDALDVVAWAERDATIGWKTWPEVWHLDEEGRFHCYYKACTSDSLTRWARNPANLHRSRREGLASPDGCADRWLIIDSRPHFLVEPPTVTEADAQGFLTLRRKLRRAGVSLVDAVVFDDDGHWWSMHELTAGTTAWAA